MNSAAEKPLELSIVEFQEIEFNNPKSKKRYPSKSEVRKADRLLKKAAAKAKEDALNKSKKLQRILQDHEDIIEVIRTEMDRAGFESKQQDFYAKGCDIKFEIPVSKQEKFWTVLQQVLNKHT